MFLKEKCRTVEKAADSIVKIFKKSSPNWTMHAC
jgi:hypothetical protein